MTSNPDFTEGPWYLTQSEDGAPRYIREEASDAVLAYVEDGGHVDPKFALPEEEQLANGQLLAAAPELYQALADLCDWVKNAGTPTSSVVQRANFALAKARGEMVPA